MLLMIGKSVRQGICNVIHYYAKANSKYMRDYDKNKESSYFVYWDVNNLYGWAMPQKLPTFNFEWVEDTSQVNEDFVKNYDEKSKVILLRLMLNIPKNHKNATTTYHF